MPDGTSDESFQYWNWNLPLRIRASVIFQGGGIRGLFFPGHLVGLRKKGIDKIFLYAGTSAGALIALGLWAGLSADDLHKFLLQKSRRRLGFALFSWPDLLRALFSWPFAGLIWIVSLPLKLVEICVRWFRPNTRWQLYVLPGCSGRKFENVLNELVIAGLKARKIHEDLIRDLLQVEIDDFRPTFEDIWTITAWVRLVAEIKSLEDADFAKVQTAYPQIVKQLKVIRFEPGRNGRVTNNILELVYGKETARDPFFPPLFLATCSVDDHLPVIFNNIDKRYLKIPIAEIARASAGHPIVFRPKQLLVDGKLKSYTDGGLMANFPVYSVYREFKRLLNPKKAEKIPQDFQAITRVPFVTLGLSVVDERSQPSYFGSILGILTGGARESLELELARIAPYFRLLQQTVSKEPQYLNFFSVSPALVTRTYQRALQYMESVDFSTTTILGDREKEKIFDNLQAMLEIVKGRFDLKSDGYIRGHLYLEADEVSVLRKKAVVCDGRATERFTDLKAQESEFAGLIGLMHRNAFPVLARVDLLQENRRNDPQKAILALTWEETKDAPSELNFSLTIPVFDLRSVSYSTGDLTIRAPGEADDCVRQFDTGITGSVIGAITIDGVLKDGELDSLPSDIESLAAEVVGSGILPTLERFAFEIGCIVSQEIDNTLNGNLISVKLETVADLEPNPESLEAVHV